MIHPSVAGARSGDRRALDILITRLHPRMARMAAYYARCCREDADDLLQEAWTGLLEALPGVDLHIGDPEQYLLRYARWRLLDAVRRSQAKRVPSTGDDELAYISCDIQHNALREVEMAGFLLELKETQRAILACLLAGMTWREAGNRLGCSSANIAYHVRQIRQRYEAWNAGESPAV